MNDTDILIIGAGASGLMAARELARADRSVLVLEARDRIGGRIFPLDEEQFGYAAQGGAEFVHGDTPTTRAVAGEAGISIVPREGAVWFAWPDGLSKTRSSLAHAAILKEKLDELEEDVPLAQFLSEHAASDELADLRRAIVRMAEAYDAADPERVSTFSLRDGWLADGLGPQFRIVGGYGPLIEFVKTDAEKHGAAFGFSAEVSAIETIVGGVRAVCADGTAYTARRILVTVPLPVLQTLSFNPSLPEKLYAASRVGFGSAMKILLRFRDRWWTSLGEYDLSDLIMLIADPTDEEISTWWTQYPEEHPVLTGWMGGPAVEKYVGLSDKEVVEKAVQSLARVLRVNPDLITSQLISSAVFNWSADPYARGAYSYATPDSFAAKQELLEPYDGKIFFAGEALARGGTDWASVEAALASGLESAERIVRQP